MFQRLLFRIVLSARVDCRNLALFVVEQLFLEPSCTGRKGLRSLKRHRGDLSLMHLNRLHRRFMRDRRRRMLLCALGLRHLRDHLSCGLNCGKGVLKLLYAGPLTKLAGSGRIDAIGGRSVLAWLVLRNGLLELHRLRSLRCNRVLDIRSVFLQRQNCVFRLVL